MFDCNLIIFYINGIVRKPHHLLQATYGAINIHPSPPEHCGCWGQPVINCEYRTHHDVAVREISEDIDYGQIYFAERWGVPASASIESVFEHSVADSLRMLEITCKRISHSKKDTRCFTPIDERWARLIDTPRSRKFGAGLKRSILPTLPIRSASS